MERRGVVLNFGLVEKGALRLSGEEVFEDVQFDVVDAA